MATTTVTVEPHAFTDWTSRDHIGQSATGYLLGRKVTVLGAPGSVGEVNLHGEHTDFHWPVFTPSLPSSDSVGLISKRDDSQFEIKLEGEVQEVVLHLGSLASVLTFDEPRTTVTKVSGDEHFQVEGNVVTGQENTPGRPTDSNGTIRVSKSATFSSVKFKLRKNYSSDLPDDGVYLQIGRMVEFADWTVRENDQTAVGKLRGQRVKAVGRLNEVNLNGEHRDFHWPFFTPSLSTSDTVGLESTRDESEFTIDFGVEVQDVIFHLGSLGSTMTFDPGTTVTKVTGDDGFDAPGRNVVTGLARNGTPSDSNGTVCVSRPRPFKSIKFRLRYGGERADGVYLQIGR